MGLGIAPPFIPGHILLCTRKAGGRRASRKGEPKLQATLQGIRILVLGGDQREIEMVRCLAGMGGQIYTVGHMPYAGYPSVTRTESFGNYPDALPEVDVIVAPMSHTDHLGQIRAVPDEGVIIQIDDELLRRFPSGTPLFIGMARPIIRELAERHRLQLIETAEDDEIAILNSIPTAEGAIQIAMGELPITIHGSRAVVIGMGRCGLTLARMLHGLGAKVCAVARNAAQLARAAEMGLETASIGELGEALENTDVVFNSVPALLLTREVLQQTARGTLIVDIASAPGGVDYTAATELGIKAILALGLPGKVAPITAGRILGRCLPGMILRALSKTTPA